MAGRSWGWGPKWVGWPDGAHSGAEEAAGGREACHGEQIAVSCGEECPGYDTRRREWRNLDAWGYKTFWSVRFRGFGAGSTGC